MLTVGVHGTEEDVSKKVKMLATTMQSNHIKKSGTSIVGLWLSSWLLWHSSTETSSSLLRKNIEEEESTKFILPGFDLGGRIIPWSEHWQRDPYCACSAYSSWRRGGKNLVSWLILALVMSLKEDTWRKERVFRALQKNRRVPDIWTSQGMIFHRASIATEK